VRRGRPGRLLAFVRHHTLFCVVVLVAAVVRLIVVAGYPPALWFSDSLPYFRALFPLSPDRVRPVGYSYFLTLLKPLHSVWLVTVLQAVMGLAMGATVYAVLRRHRLTAVFATLAAVPVLFSVYELQMEHFVLSDTLFGLLVTTAIALMLWQQVPSVWVCGLTGLVLALAILDREQGVLLPIAFCLYLGAQLARRARVRKILAGAVTLCLTAGLPLAFYAWSFRQSNGSFQLTSSTGAFLYSRVSTFARCSLIKPPADERWLCIATPPGRRPDPTYYIWSATSPINVKPPGGWAFDSRANRLATNFALRAIEAQPAAYLAAVLHSTLENFEPQFKDSAAWYSERHYRFPASTPQSVRALARANQELPDYRSGYAYNGRRNPSTRIVRPFAGWMRAYQRFVILPGPLLALIAVAGLTGMVTAWRQLGGPALLPWLTGFALIITPAATTDYSARYLIAAIPAFCIAGALGIRQASDWDREAEAAKVTQRR
jgi:hypothetical protein